MIVSAEHQINAVAIEQWQPCLADALIRPVAILRGTQGILMHLHDDPVDRMVAGGGFEGALQPTGLSALTVTMDIKRSAGRNRRVAGTWRGLQSYRAAHERAAVLVDDIVGGE